MKPSPFMWGKKVRWRLQLDAKAPSSWTKITEAVEISWTNPPCLLSCISILEAGILTLPLFSPAFHNISGFVSSVTDFRAEPLMLLDGGNPFPNYAIFRKSQDGQARIYILSALFEMNTPLITDVSHNPQSSYLSELLQPTPTRNFRTTDRQPVPPYSVLCPGITIWEKRPSPWQPPPLLWYDGCVWVTIIKSYQFIKSDLVWRNARP